MICVLVGFYCLMWGIVGTIAYTVDSLKLTGMKRWKEVTIYLTISSVWPVIFLMMAYTKYFRD